MGAIYGSPGTDVVRILGDIQIEGDSRDFILRISVGEIFATYKKSLDKEDFENVQKKTY